MFKQKFLLAVLLICLAIMPLSWAIAEMQTKIDLLEKDDFYENQKIIKEIIIHGEEALPYLIDALGSDNANIRRYSAQAIGDIGIKTDEALNAALQRLSAENDENVKANLIYILDVFNDIRAIDALTDKLENLDESENIRYRAAYAIARFMNSKDYEALKNFINDDSIFVRKTAIWGLGLSKVKESENLLKPIFEDKSEPITIRYWTARALADLGNNINFDSFKEEFDKKFIFIRTGPDYILKTDISEQALNDAAKQIQLLDSFHKAFFNAYKKIKNKSTLVLLFKSENDFNDYAEIYYPSFHNTGGGYVPSENLLFTYDRPDYERTIRLIKHEWTHRFMDLYLYQKYWEGDLTEFYGGFPVWFDEGVAEYVAYANLETNEPSISTEHASAIASKVESGTLRSIYDIAKDEDPYRFGISYSEVWGLTYFLINYNDGQYLPVIQSIIQSMKSGSTNINDIFINSFADLDQVDVEWKNFIKKTFSAETAVEERPQGHPVEAKCFDSDAEDNPSVKSTLTSIDTSVFWHNYEDYCVDNIILVEMKCDPSKTSYTFDYVDCSAYSAVCQGGICITKTPDIGEAQKKVPEAIEGVSEFTKQDAEEIESVKEGQRAPLLFLQGAQKPPIPIQVREIQAPYTLNYVIALNLILIILVVVLLMRFKFRKNKT